jgi:hypothetical protein
MNIDKFPVVSNELIKAIRDFFPITENTLASSHDEIQRIRGVYDLINFLTHVNDVQTNPDSE